MSFLDRTTQRFTSREALLSELGKNGSLADADLMFLDLQGLDLSGIDFSGATLSGSNLSGCDLSNTVMEFAYIQDANMEKVIADNANMANIHLQRTLLTNIKLTKCNLDQANILLCDVQSALFENCSIQSALMVESNFDKVSFIGTDLTDSCMRAATTEDTLFKKCIFDRADLRKITITKAKFIDIQAEDALYYGKAPWDGKIKDEDWNAQLHAFDGE